MSTLHVISHSPFGDNRLSSCLRLLGSQDALLLCGDDHAAKSSLTAHQSEHVLVTAMAPVLYPATTDEILSFGQLGWALSRFSGLYVAIKAVTDTLDLTTTVTLPGHGFPISMPDLAGRPSPHLRLNASALQQDLGLAVPGDVQADCAAGRCASCSVQTGGRH